MFKGVNTLSRKIIVYTTSLVLITTLIFTTISISTLIMFKNYTIKKTEKTFKENAKLNLEKEVLFYAKTLEKAMDTRKGIVYMFGKLIEGKLRKQQRNTDSLASIFEEMNEALDMREILVMDSDLHIMCHFPTYIDTLSAVRILKSNIKKIKNSTDRVIYIDFHINNDNSVSYSFVYLAKDREHHPVYIFFDFYPYDIYSLIKTAQLEPYSQKYLWVINSKGELIYDPPTRSHPLITLLDHVNLTDSRNGKALSEIVKQHILKGESGVARYTFRKVDKFVGYTYIKDLGWGLGLTLPTEMLYAPINKLSRDINRRMLYALSILSIVNTLVILLSILVAMQVAKRVIQPIEMTTEAIEAIIEGNGCKRIPACGNDELGRLTEAVNKLMDLFDKVWKNIGKNRGGSDG